MVSLWLRWFSETFHLRNSFFLFRFVHFVDLFVCCEYTCPKSNGLFVWPSIRIGLREEKHESRSRSVIISHIGWHSLRLCVRKSYGRCARLIFDDYHFHTNWHRDTLTGTRRTSNMFLFIFRTSSVCLMITPFDRVAFVRNEWLRKLSGDSCNSNGNGHNSIGTWSVEFVAFCCFHRFFLLFADSRQWHRHSNFELTSMWSRFVCVSQIFIHRILSSRRQRTKCMDFPLSPHSKEEKKKNKLLSIQVTFIVCAHRPIDDSKNKLFTTCHIPKYIVHLTAFDGQAVCRWLFRWRQDTRKADKKKRLQRFAGSCCSCWQRTNLTKYIAGQIHVANQ